MRLLDRIRAAPPAPAETRYSLADYLAQVSQFTFGGLNYQGVQQTLAGGDAEDIDRTVAGYVRGAYEANGVVFACSVLRMFVFAQSRFAWQRLRRGQAGDLFTNQQLRLLERPWAGGTTSDLLKRMLQDADVAGNAYIARLGSELVRLDPVWTSIVLEPVEAAGVRVGVRRIGYVYQDGPQGDQAAFAASEVAHFAPIPDPTANFRGMSWLTPVIREIEADNAATKHKAKFFENGATPNMVIRADMDAIRTLENFREYIAEFERQHQGVDNAYRTLFLAGAADVEVVGSDLKQLDFKASQGAGETRIAAAAGAHPVLVGLSEGLQGSALNAGNYGQARRRFGDATMRPLWRDAAGALETLVPPPDVGSRLWYDVRDNPFLREDSKDEAEITQIQAQSIRTLTDAGYTPESAIAAVQNNDLSMLDHSGYFSVQLQTLEQINQDQQPAIGPGDTSDGQESSDDE